MTVSRRIADSTRAGRLHAGDAAPAARA